MINFISLSGIYIRPGKLNYVSIPV